MKQPLKKQLDQQQGYKENEKGYDRENIKTHFEDQILLKVKEFVKDMELQHTKHSAQNKIKPKDKESLQISQKIQEISQSKLFKITADRIAKCPRFKQPEIISYTNMFNNLQKVFDDLQANKKIINIKINRALELFNLETFKYFEEIHDELIKIEGAGKCGMNEVMKSFDDKIKSFNKYCFAWQFLPQMEGHDTEESTFKPILNEKELKRFVSELVEQSYPSHHGFKEVERIVEKVVHKEVPVYLEKESAQRHDHTREAHEYLFGLTKHQNINKALELYHLEADTHHNIFAQNVLGQLYAEGKMVDKNMDKAVNYYHKSSLKNDPVGLYQVGTFLLQGKMKSAQVGKHLNSHDAEIEEGLQNLRQADKFGSADAMSELGLFYADGIHSHINSSNWIIKPDLKQAEAFHFKAAKLNNPKSLLYLGLFYQSHKDYKSQYHQSQVHPYFDYIRLSKEMGFPQADYELGICYEKGLGVQVDHNKAKQLFREGSIRGEIKSIEMLIQQLYKEAKESNQDADYQTLQDQLRQALINHPDFSSGLYILGTLYEQGHGVSKDSKTAFNYYQKAAKFGCIESLMKLGDFYYLGVEIPQNLKESLHFYEQASVRGKIEAKVQAGVILLHGGSGVSLDQVRAYDYFTEAHQHGNLDAEYQLALMYLEGLYVKKDEKKCIEILQKAENKGHVQSKTKLQQLGYQIDHQGKWQVVTQSQDLFGGLASPGFGQNGNNMDFMGVVGTSQLGQSYLSQKNFQKKSSQIIYKRQNDESILVSQIVQLKNSQSQRKTKNIQQQSKGNANQNLNLHLNQAKQQAIQYNQQSQPFQTLDQDQYFNQSLNQNLSQYHNQRSNQQSMLNTKSKSKSQQRFDQYSRQDSTDHSNQNSHSKVPLASPKYEQNHKIFQQNYFTIGYGQ